MNTSEGQQWQRPLQQWQRQQWQKPLQHWQRQQWQSDRQAEDFIEGVKKLLEWIEDKQA